LRPIVVVPFATEIHGKEYYVAILDIIKQYLLKHGVEIHSSIVVNTDEAEEVGRKYSEFLPIALVLTGGTSKLIDSFINGGNYERLIILAHSEHNSLASAISSMNKAERKGVISFVYHCSDLNSLTCISTIDRMIKVAKTVASIIGLKVGIIANKLVKDGIDETFESKFKAKVIIKTIDEFLKDMETIDISEVNESKEELAKSLKIESSSPYLDNIARLYLALKKFVRDENLDAVTIDCFPFIMKTGITPCIPLAVLNRDGIIAGCEADLPSLLGLILARCVTGKSGWIANIVDVFSNKLYLAHCTIALDIIKNQNILPHFETGKPYALTGEYIGDIVTLISIDRDLTMAAITVGRVIASGNLGLPSCRTQMLIELDYMLDLLPNVAPNNHHIVLHNDKRRELMEILYILGLDIVEYKEIVM
jgi:L-fucose isomerase-like protein